MEEQAPEHKSPEEKRKELITNGSIDIRVKRAGMYQVLTFRLVKKQTSFGIVPFITLKRFLDLSELMRIADEFQLPVEAPNGKIFPKGKKEGDFAESDATQSP